MNTPKLLIATAAILATGFVVWRAMAPAPAVAPPVTAAPADPSPTTAAAPTLDDAPEDVDRARLARYRFTYTLESRIDGAVGPAARVQGVWQTEGLADGRVEARLTDVTAGGHALVPRPEALTRPVELVPADDGPLAAIAFDARTEDTARRLFTALATAFWFTPGDGARWEAEEEDLLGRALVRYTRVAEGTVERTTLRYLSLRDVTGARAESEAAKVEPVVTTAFVFDEQGPVSVRLRSLVAYDMGEHTPRLVATSEVTFERIDTRLVARRAGALTGSPISGHFDPTADRDQVDVARVDGATAADLVAEAQRVAAIDRQDPDRAKWRATTVQRMASLVRIDPAAAAELADAVRANVGETDAYTLLTGGLGSADSVVGAEALAGLLGDDLPALAQRNAIDHLMLTGAGSPTTVEALEGQLDGANGPAAAAALGAQARTLSETDPEVAAEAVETLLARWQGAVTPDEAVQTLRALGNSGSPEAFEALSGAVWSSDPRLAEAATFGLRFVPGERVDDVLDAVLARGGNRLPAAIQAVGHRDPERWRPTLEALRDRHAATPNLVSAIEGVLSTWSRGDAG